MVLLEAVGNVFQEDDAEDDVVDGQLRVRPSGCLRQSVSLRSAVFRRVHVVAELVGGEPELRFEAEVGGGFRSGRCFTGHGSGGETDPADAGLESERRAGGVGAGRFFGWHVGSLRGEAQKRYAVKLERVK